MLRANIILPPGKYHHLILKVGIALNYKLTLKGVCQGMALCWTEACFANEEHRFTNRVYMISRKIFFSPEGEVLPANSKERILALKNAIEAAIEKNRKKEPLSLTETYLIEICAFYDKLVLYQDPTLYSDFFKTRHTQKDIEAISMFAASSQNKGLIDLGSIVSLYKKEETKEYFQAIHQVASSENPSSLDKTPTQNRHLAILLSTEDHAIALCYRPFRMLWSLMDINHFPAIHVSEKTIHALIGRSYGFSVSPNHIAFTSTFLTSAAYPFHTDLSDLRKQLSPVISSSFCKRAGFEKLSYLAAKIGDLPTLTLLLDHGANINAARKDGTTPIFIATDNGDIATLTLLLNRGAHLHATRTDGTMPIFLAAQNGNTDVLALLLNHGANVNATLPDGTTLAFIAAQNGHIHTLTLLLDHGANLNTARKDGTTPIFIATDNGDIATLTLLLNRGAHLHATRTDGTMPIFLAAQNGNTDVLALLLNHGANVNATLPNGTTLAFIAAQTGNRKLLELLIQYGAQLNTPCRKEGITPIFIATQNRNTETLQLLIKHGANINATRTDGASALLIATQNCDTDTMKLLLDHGAEINASALNGSSPVFIALKNNDLPTLKLLLDYHPDLNTPIFNGLTPIWVSILNGNMEILTLLANRSNLDLAYKNLSPVFFAAQNGHIDMLRILAQHGANLTQNVNGVTPLCIAAQNDHLDIVHFLLEALDLKQSLPLKMRSKALIEVLSVLKEGDQKKVLTHLQDRLSHFIPDDNDTIYALVFSAKKSTRHLLVEPLKEKMQKQPSFSIERFLACFGPSDREILHSFKRAPSSPETMSPASKKRN